MAIPAGARPAPRRGTLLHRGSRRARPARRGDAAGHAACSPAGFTRERSPADAADRLRCRSL